jgi:hypothetical protein
MKFLKKVEAVDYNPHLPKLNDTVIFIYNDEPIVEGKIKSLRGPQNAFAAIKSHLPNEMIVEVEDLKKVGGVWKIELVEKKAH